MGASLFLARLWGPFIIVIGVGLLLNLSRYKQISMDFRQAAGLVYVTGIITFTSGLAMVLAHNLWTDDWRAIITVLGWITLIKGAWLVIFPQTLTRMSDFYLKNMKFVIIPWVIMVAIGVFLCVKGFGL